MSRRDGTGPLAQGSGAGRGAGRGQRKNFDGFGGGTSGKGPGGYCVCPACGIKAPHQPGTPCIAISCPKCGIKMIRG